MFDPFFDQESPQIAVDGLIASLDLSPSYELDAKAVFKAGRHYLVVEVSGCSCWPDRGGTTQTVCSSRAEVDRILTGEWRDLLQQCQDILSRAKRSAFVAPTVDEVDDYCNERVNHVNPQAFVDFYESKGWKVGNQKMCDWKAAVRTS